METASDLLEGFVRAVLTVVQFVGFLFLLLLAGVSVAELGESGETGQCVEPLAGDSLTEIEERLVLSNSSPTRVCQAYGGDLRSWSCVLEEAEADQILFRGGPNVTSVDGLQFCAACRSGQTPGGDSRAAWLLATSGTPAVRCICGYR